MAAAPPLHVCIFASEFAANEGVKRREPKTEASPLPFSIEHFIASGARDD
jgi:hypothetical protein